MIKQQLDAACNLDPQLCAILDLTGYPEPRLRPPGFATLVQIINAQQLSTKAAGAIWQRLENSCGGELTPEKILDGAPHMLLECGLSARKTEYITGLSEMLVSGELDLTSLDLMSDEEMVSALVMVKGIGRWSAEIYGMFALGRKDMFPAKDLALQVAVQKYAGMSDRPDEKKTRTIAQRWSPYRSAVAILMWKYYGTATLD